jgi:uncharacterized damage-inducible protein DinB
MATFSNTGEFREAEFTSLSLAGAKFNDVTLDGAEFRSANLAQVRMRDVYLEDVDIDGEVVSLRVNGVDVMPLVEAELTRRHPEMALLRATTPDGLREAWAMLESKWAQTMRRAEQLPPADLDRSVDDEWSFKQTLRHLVRATDSWLGHAILGEEKPLHPIGLIFTGGPSGEAAGPEADFAFDEIVAVREGRQAMVRSFLDGATQADLDRPRGPFHNAEWPPPEERTALHCLHVILNEEWHHCRYANRDLDVIAGAAGGS